MTAAAGVEACDLLVVGAGPAGLAAAAEAGRLGLDVLVVDEMPEPGGRALTQPLDAASGSASGRAWVDALAAAARDSGARLWQGMSLWSLSPGWRALLTPVDPTGADAPPAVEARAVVVAVGATEVPLALPGWTLPGVLALGAAQRLLYGHGIPAGRRVALVGQDAFARALARDLRLAGATVVGQVGLPGAGATGDLAPLEILGRDAVERLRVAGAGPDGPVEDWEVDAVVVSGGQLPLTDVSALAGCPLEHVAALGGFVPVHGAAMETPVPGLFVAGSAAGIATPEAAAAQGRLAAAACARLLAG